MFPRSSTLAFFFSAMDFSAAIQCKLSQDGSHYSVNPGVFPRKTHDMSSKEGEKVIVWD